MRMKMGIPVVLVAMLACVACSESPSTPSAVPAPTGGQGITNLLQRGIEQGNKGDLNGAEKTFRSLLEIDKTNKYAWYDLGVVQQQRKRGNDAATSYDKALVADPGFTPAMFNKAIILETSDDASALRLYKQIVALNPKASTTYLRMGNLQLRKGDTKGARESFSNAVAIDPELRGMVPEQYRPAPVGP